MRRDRIDARLIEVEVDGETTVYSPLTDSVDLPNASASEIWRRTPITSVAQLNVEIAEVFGIPVEEARAGVEAGVRLLVDEQLLVEQDRIPADGSAAEVAAG